MSIEYVGRNDHLQVTHTPDSLFYFIQVTDLNNGKSIALSQDDANDLVRVLTYRAADRPVATT